MTKRARAFYIQALLAGVFVASMAGCQSGAGALTSSPAMETAVAAPVDVPSHDPLILPNEPDSLKFAVIGDSGTGGTAQFRVGEVMAYYHAHLGYGSVLMAGDNMYGSEGPRDYTLKFELPYQALLKAGVKFYAALGNHDQPDQRFYEPFNLNGERYRTFKLADSVRLFVLDSTYVDPEQLEWLKKELEGSDSPWKLALFHHPIYSGGKRHGSDTELRQALEPLFVANGVDVVFAGHDHFYERTKPQRGITHFVVGNSAKLRRGNLNRNQTTAAGYDTGYAFMLVEILNDELHFQAINDQYKTIDSGVIREISSKVKTVTE